MLVFLDISYVIVYHDSMGTSERDVVRAITKLTDPEGRSQTARALIEARKERKDSAEIVRRQREAEEKTAELVSELQVVEEKKTAELLARQRSALARMHSLFGGKDVRVSQLESEVTAITEQTASLQQELSALRRELDRVAERHASIPNPADLLRGYYESQASTPLSLEQKQDLLKPERISNLSTEEYIALWRKLNPYFLTHVTRQGFRDHNMMLFHSAGMREYHNGFIGALRDARQLRSPMVVRELPDRSEASVEQWLEDILVLGSEEAALQALEHRFHISFADTPRYPDSTSIHFAAQDVAHQYYGAERGNEVFFVFPTDVIASQYDFAFHGGRHEFTRPQSELKWNDVFVWPSDIEQGNIPLDTGFVFLPSETRVDPETGSKYASEVRVANGKETRLLIEDMSLVRKVVELPNSFSAVGRLTQKLITVRSASDAWGVEEALDALREVIPEALRGVGMTDDTARTVAVALLDRFRYEESLFSEQVVKDVLEDSGALYLRPKETISAKRFWQDWFAANPESAPKHVVFYDGDPTTSVFRFLASNGIGRADTSETHGKLLGFADRYVADMHTDPRAYRGQDELLEVCKKVIAKRFATGSVSREY